MGVAVAVVFSMAVVLDMTVASAWVVGLTLLSSCEVDGRRMLAASMA